VLFSYQRQQIVADEYPPPPDPRPRHCTRPRLAQQSVLADFQQVGGFGQRERHHDPTTSTLCPGISRNAFCADSGGNRVVTDTPPPFSLRTAVIVPRKPPSPSVTL
jgi:hypothetical protein